MHEILSARRRIGNANSAGLLLREVKGLELDGIERETASGKVVYEAEANYDDTEIESEIDANGKLLGKEVSREDDDDDDDEEEDENG